MIEYNNKSLLAFSSYTRFIYVDLANIYCFKLLDVLKNL